MIEEQMILKLNDHDHEIASLKHRVTNIETKQTEIGQLTLSVNELATNMKYMVEEQKNQGDRLERLEKEPLETSKFVRRTLISSVISTVVGAILGAILVLILKG